MSRIVPNEIPSGAKILCVGESPGEWEERLGRPFVSIDVAKQAGFSPDNNTAGELLERYMGRLGLSRNQFGLANLYKRRPPGNKFKAILTDPYLQESIEDLRRDIIALQPNVIIALGGWPLYFLTGKCSRPNKKAVPGSGILTYRGSRYHCTMKGCEGIKVFPTMHPAYVLRNWRMNPLFLVDLTHAVEDSHFPELRLPEYDELIEPGSNEAARFTESALHSEWISTDIETFPGGRYSCVGFSYRDRQRLRDSGICITYKQPYLTEVARTLWHSETPKIFQYGTYDINFMRNFYGWEIGGYYNNVGWDTFIASASILPDYPRSLDFLTSLYTRFQYYKQERKVWKETNDMNILWRYNVKDCISTYQIALAQMEEIGGLFGSKIQ